MAVSQFTDNHVTYLQSRATFLLKPSFLYEHAGQLNSANLNSSIFFFFRHISNTSPHISRKPSFIATALNTILYTQLFFFGFLNLFLIISIQVDFKFCELTDFWFYLSLSLWYLACVRSSVSIYRMGAY